MPPLRKTLAMPSTSTERRWSSSSHTKEKFPDFDHSISREYLVTFDENENTAATSSRSPSPAKTNGTLHSERWLSRKESHLAWGNYNGHTNLAPPRRDGRQRSLSDAFKTIRSRKASVSENAHEIAEALKAPVSFKIVVRGFNQIFD